MDTQVRTPQSIFMQPQRLLVPLFQRPYVWNEELQWEPLWKDLERVADRLLQRPGTAQAPHFLGAVVLQQVSSQTSDLQQRTIIDGQQRLTTLQLLLDAIHAELASVGSAMPAARLEPLIANAQAFCRNREDRFKVWPTNRDRPAFNEVMDAASPVDYSALEHHSSRMAKAHQFFATQCREWLHAAGAEQVHSRAEAIERSARELVQIVVIDLTAAENAQDIFETLNARGAVLTAAPCLEIHHKCKLHKYHTASSVLKTKTRAQGGSIVATLPAEVTRRLALLPGQDLYWREAGPGMFLVTALDSAQVEALAAMEEAVDQYREVFSALAK